jgi:carbon-monoxide dehydrogenase medium subunit
MDGMAVMSCLVPAARAHKAQIVTIEDKKRWKSTLSAGFHRQGAVQCSYCTPSFIMSSVMLLDELICPAERRSKKPSVVIYAAAQGIIQSLMQSNKLLNIPSR